MAGITLFGYRSGTSYLHGLDPRLKLLIVCLMSLCLIRASTLAVFFYGCLSYLGLRTAHIPLIETAKGLKSFMVLLFFVFLARALTEPGFAVLEIWGFTITKQGLAIGGLIAFKFLLVMLTGLIFSSTTSLSDIKKALQWYFKPIPFIPEQRLSVMIGLSFGFIPVLFKQAAQISEARKARCADLNKGMIRQTIGLALPLLKKTFNAADQISTAMEARCYSDDRTNPDFSPGGYELFFSIGAFCTAGILIMV